MSAEKAEPHRAHFRMLISSNRIWGSRGAILPILPDGRLLIGKRSAALG
jgi:hypothetical protein